jgi:hypothetical protein
MKYNHDDSGVYVSLAFWPWSLQSSWPSCLGCKDSRAGGREDGGTEKERQRDVVMISP